MNKKESKISQIRNIIFGADNDKGEVELTKDYKTKDGAILRIEDIADDADVKQINEDGEITDVEDGKYILPDEDKEIEVKDSKIVNIEEVVDEEDEPKEDETPKEDEPKEDGEQSTDANLEDGKPDATIELPVGEHTIDGKIYTVSEKVENEGTDTEYKHNVIDSIVPVDGEQPKEDEQSTDEKFDNESIKTFIEEFKSVLEDVDSIKKENEELKSSFTKFSKEPSDESVGKNKVKLEPNSKEDKIKFYSK